MKDKLPERRRFVRIESPVKLVVDADGQIYNAMAKNISAVGINFEVAGEFERFKKLKVDLYLPAVNEPVSINGKVVWISKCSLEDNAPYDIGVEIVSVVDKDKDAFLKYLCDLLYDSTSDVRS